MSGLAKTRKKMPEDTILTEGARFSKLIDEALAEYKKWLHKASIAEKAYTVAKQEAWTMAEGKTVAQRQAWVDDFIVAEKLDLNIAESGAKINLEALRSRRQQMSYVQSLLKHPEMTLEATMAGQI